MPLRALHFEKMNLKLSEDNAWTKRYLFHSEWVRLNGLLGQSSGGHRDRQDAVLLKWRRNSLKLWVKVMWLMLPLAEAVSFPINIIWKMVLARKHFDLGLLSWHWFCILAVQTKVAISISNGLEVMLGALDESARHLMSPGNFLPWNIVLRTPQSPSALLRRPFCSWKHVW